MKRTLALVLAAVLILALLAVGAVWILRRDQARFERGEIRLEVSNPGGARIALYRSGRTLDEAQLVPMPSDGTWLAEGNYFLEASRDSLRQLFPIPLKGFHIGPDRGRFTATIRGLGFEAPPVLDATLAQFVFVPGGYFAIGDARNPGEPHFVWTTGFFIGAFEVTNGEFRRFIRDSAGYEWRENWTEAGWNWKLSSRSQATAWMEPPHDGYERFGRDDLPVVLVTWYEANAFGRWLTRRLGKGQWLFRMPTEAEWEKAARGPDSFDYGLGTALSEPESGLYNWKKNPGAEVTLVGFQETPARYRANRYGVYHASGNAAEWTQSVFRPYNARTPYMDDGRNDDATNGMRVTRGGSWYSANVVRLHLAYREEFQPEMSSNDLGFRMAALPLPLAAPNGLR